MEHIGHPIMSDFIYADRVNCMATQHFCPRVFLHHFQISIPKPCGNWKEYKTHAVDLPKQLKHVLDNVRDTILQNSNELNKMIKIKLMKKRFWKLFQVLTADEASNKLLAEHIEQNKDKLREMFDHQESDARQSRRNMEADFRQSKRRRYDDY